MQIAKYVADVSFQIDTKGIKKVDKALTDLEKKLSKFSALGKNLGFTIGSFKVDQKRLDMALGNALDMASARLSFQVERFTVNQAALNRTMTNAMRQAGHIPFNPSVPNRPNGPINPTISPSGRIREERVGRRSGGMGGIGIGPVFGAGLAIAAGGYGLSSLNKINQKVVAAKLQSQAVVMQAGGTEEEGTASNEWLKAQADRVGFNYLDSVQGYNNTLAGLTHAGMSVQQGQGVFKGFSEIGRVMKLDAVHQKRLLYAVSEIADMNELQKRQMNMVALALPGGKSLFAEAWQQKTGGKLHGQEAEAALLAAIKARQVKGDILIPVANLASERAAPNLEKAGQASQAEQARYQNAIARLAAIASDNGVEEGFARIFRTLTAGLNESNDLVKTLSEGFNEATKWASELLLFPQSFVRALEGKDSLVADWLGIDKTKELQEDWKNIKQIFTDISSIHFDFLPTLKSTAEEIKIIFDAIAEFQKWKNGDLPTKTTEYGDITKIKPFESLPEYTSPVGIAGAALDNTLSNMRKAQVRGEAVYDNPNSPFYRDHDLAGYDVTQADKAAAAEYDKANGYTNNNQIDVNVNIEGASLSGLDSEAQAHLIGTAVANQIALSFDQVNVQFPIKQ